MNQGLHEYLDGLQTTMNNISSGIYERFLAKRMPETKASPQDRIQYQA